MTPTDSGDPSPEFDSEHLTDEVGSEGGSPGDLEEAEADTGTGSEAGETWQPDEERKRDLPRDEGAPGRRSP